MDPYRVFNDLDADYRPYRGGEPLPPLYPSRLRAVLDAFGMYSFEQDARLHGAQIPKEKKQPRSKK